MVSCQKQKSETPLKKYSFGIDIIRSGNPIYYRYLRSGGILHAQPFEAAKMSGINVFVFQCTRLSCLKNIEGWAQ